ncbi:hypothetical protein PVAND_016347 [Polypedilum vanderplanki]|uniref:Uncharacterized protein n=1 Tax=Polypedilum vanderplanki TaxID=319348 RepID=A0A9J6BFN1_POLVA|nr:hypothetical protein PVAND_016347 [Polypedilum vanderplanki]
MFQTVLEIFSTFGAETSIHGINFILTCNQNWINRIFWFLALVISSILLALNVNLAYQKYQNEPSIVIRSNMRDLKEIPMPALTICSPLFAINNLANLNNFYKNYYEKKIFAANMTSKEANYLMANLQVCRPNSIFDLAKFISNRTDTNIVKLLLESSQSVEEFLVKCFLKYFPKNCTKMMNRILTDKGFCYTFNMQDFDIIFNAEKISEDFYSYKKEKIIMSNNSSNDKKVHLQWTLEKGFSPNHKDDDIPIPAFMRKESGIIMRLDEKDSKNVCHENLVLTYFLHLPNEIPTPFHHTNIIKFNDTETITLTAKMYKTNENLRGYSPEIRSCYFEGEKKLKFFKSYTKANCEFECMANQTFETCGCVKFSMPRENHTKVCDETKIKCVLNVMMNFPNSNGNFESCDCLKPCSDIKYFVAFRDASLFSYQHGFNRSAMSVFSFRFDDFSIEEEEKYSAYTFQIYADRQKFQAWKQKHQKVYKSPTDEDQAMENMLRNQKEIDEHNKLFEQGKVTFTRATWEHSDLDYEQKLKKLTGNKGQASNDSIMMSSFVQASKSNIQKSPDEVDWVKSGLVNSIRNQGKCGSCWAFTAVGVADGALLKQGIKTRLSEQNLVDCSKANYGCDGGDAYSGLKFIASKGISSISDYPYTGKDGKCKNLKKVNFNLGNIKYEKLRGNENRLKDIVANFGPVGVAIDAADSFMNYESGVYNNPKCSKRANHAVLLVGYGRDEKLNMDYWLVKNSWGTSWGENGYVRMARNKNNQCAIAGEVTYIL